MTPSRFMPALALLLALAIRAAPARGADPADPPAGPAPTLAQLRAQTFAEQVAKYKDFPIINVKSVGDVIHLALRDNDLVATTTLEPTTGEGAILRSPDLPGLNIVTVSKPPSDPAQPEMPVSFKLTNYSFNTADYVMAQTEISSQIGRLDIAQLVQLVEDETHTIQYMQVPVPNEGEARVTMYVQITTKPPVELHCLGKNLVDLRRQFPAETTKYLSPILRTFGKPGLLSYVDPRLAWQVFADAFAPSADLQSAVKAVIAKLDADNFQDREAASVELTKLGQPAALTLMRQSRSGSTDDQSRRFSDEQISRIDTFLASFKVVSDAQANTYRQDRDFLIDCLTADDAALRELALKQLRTVTGKPIEFDLTAPADRRLTAVAKLHDTLGAAPATQSAPPTEKTVEPKPN